MNKTEMDALTAHYNRYFEQNDVMVIHPTEDMQPHMDALLYPPTEKYPFWKLAGMGACDHEMKAPKHALGNRNEYFMAIAPEEDMMNRDIANWYYSMLLRVAMYPVVTGTFFTYGHWVEWPVNDGEEMVGAYIEFPQMISDPGILRCKLGMFKTAVCLTPVLLNRAEMELLRKVGPERFSYFLFPENGKPCHFLCERTRTVKF